MIADPFAPVLARFGDRFDPEVLAATIRHWAPRVNTHQLASPVGISEVSYGAHERHRLDLFPVEATRAPMVLFVHGGGFSSGDKRASPPFYSNVGRYFAAHGFFAATMNYRLAPEAPWPAGSEDVDRAAHWLQERADLYGGDSRRFCVIGQSAGACHVANWLFHPRFSGQADRTVQAAVLMSGLYRAQAPLSAGQLAYFGDDASLHIDRSPLSHATSNPAPLLLTMAEHDPATLRAQTGELASRLSAAGVAPTTLELKGHNHVSPMMSLGSDAGDVGEQLRAFITSATRPR